MTTNQHNNIIVFMIPDFTPNGLLPPGIHSATWHEFKSRFGFSERRRKQLSGLRKALITLRTCGCCAVYIDGSFVTSKRNPGDFDGVWNPAGVNGDQLSQLAPLLLDDTPQGRMAQKAMYQGELFIEFTDLYGNRSHWIDFFQQDRDGQAKGIVSIDLETLDHD